MAGPTKKPLKKTRHPTFARMNYGRTSRSRIKDNWRKPRGVDNKQRVGLKYVPASPGIGYRNPKAVRGLHPSGLRLVLVNNVKEVMSAAKDSAIMIAGGVGAKKREAMAKVAAEKGLKVLNA